MNEITRGLALQRDGKFHQAEAAYRRALNDTALCTNAYCHLGILYHEMRRFDIALQSYDAALARDPNFAIALSNRSNTLAALNRMEEAVTSCKAALSVAPDYARAWTNLGAIQNQMGLLDEAADSFQKALQLSADTDDLAHTNRGASLLRLGRTDAAAAHMNRALAANPLNAEARRNLAFIHLMTGNYEVGWREYEWRWQCADTPQLKLPMPRYAGENLRGKSVLLIAEQGLGDVIQFVRYGELIASAGGRVLILCQPALYHILHSLKFAENIFAFGAPLPQADYYMPMMSAPLAFNTRLDTIPATQAYLQADPFLARKWQRWLARYPGIRIGVVWQGNPDHVSDGQRSFRLADLAPLAGENVTFVPLQTGAAREQLLHAPREMRLADPGDRLDGDCGAFMDTAAIICHLDVVVSCDTSVAHLAGALGARTWLALGFAADWRWLTKREDSPWYPSVRVFRQPSVGDWAGVFSSMAAAIDSITWQDLSD